MKYSYLIFYTYENSRSLTSTITGVGSLELITNQKILTSRRLARLCIEIKEKYNFDNIAINSYQLISTRKR